MSSDDTFQRRLRRAFMRFAAATALLYRLLIVLVLIGTEDVLLRRYLGAVVENAVAQLERPREDGTLQVRLERIQALSPPPHPGTLFAPGIEGVRLYVRASPDLPPWATSYGPGTHRRFDDGAMIRVAPVMGGSQTLYAIVDGDGVPGSVLARQLALRLVSLTREVNGHREGPMAFSGARRGDEVGALSRGFAALVDRLSDVLQREREFTRFASHELRTPVAVFQSSLAILRATDEAPVRERALERMAQSANDMADLVAALLALGRSPEESDLSGRQALQVSSVIQDLLDRLSPRVGQKGLRIERQLDARACVFVAPGLCPVLIDNLLRNAVAYAGSWIVVRADARGIEIENDVRKQPRSSSSMGYGLQIVSRICERQGWAFTHGLGNGIFSARVAFQAEPERARRDDGRDGRNDCAQGPDGCSVNAGRAASAPDATRSLEDPPDGR